MSVPQAWSVERGPVGRLRQDRRIAFLLVGGFNTAFGFAVFTTLELTLGRVVHYLVVLAIAHLVGVLEAVALYRRLVFKVEGGFWLDLVRYEFVNVGTLLINAAALPLLVELGGVPVIPAQAVVMVVNAAISFLGHKHFSFRRPA